MLEKKSKDADLRIFNQLFETYKNLIYNYVLSILKNPQSAEDITQEIFIKLWLCRDMLDQVNNLDGYIFKIARNISLNKLRKIAYDEKLLKNLQQYMNPEANNIDQKMFDLDYDKLVQDALNKLSPQRRLVYQLSRQDGLNHEEIAVRLNLSKNTVKNHLVDALRLIRDRLGHKMTRSLTLTLFLLQ